MHFPPPGSNSLFLPLHLPFGYCNVRQHSTGTPNQSHCTAPAGIAAPKEAHASGTIWPTADLCLVRAIAPFPKFRNKAIRTLGQTIFLLFWTSAVCSGLLRQRFPWESTPFNGVRSKCSLPKKNTAIVFTEESLAKKFLPIETCRFRIPLPVRGEVDSSLETRLVQAFF